MTNTEWNDIKAEVLAKATLDWPHPPPKDMHEFMRALGRVIESAMLAGQTIGINETAANARRQQRGVGAPSLAPRFHDGHGNDIGHLVPVLRPAG